MIPALLPLCPEAQAVSCIPGTKTVAISSWEGSKVTSLFHPLHLLTSSPQKAGV